MGGRSENLRVEHARHAHVRGVFRLAGHLVAAVGTEQRFADKGELRDGLQHRLLSHAALDPLALGQLGIRHPFAAVRLGHDRAVQRHQISRGGLQSLGRQLHEHRAGLRGRRPQRRTEKARAHRAESPHVPWAEVGIAHHHVDAVQRHAELVGEHLGQRGDDALAHLDLAGEARDAAVLADPEKGVQVGGQPLAEAATAATPAAAFALRENLCLAERHEDEDPASHDLEKLPAVRGEVIGNVREIELQVFVAFHGLFPPLIPIAADSMAATILAWAPQRHRLSSIDFRISARLGRGFFRSRPTAWRTIPGVQKPH